MKKLLFILIAAVAFTLSSCEKKVYETIIESNRFVREFTVQSAHWKRVGDINAFGSHYIYEFNEPQLTPSILRGADVNVYFVFDQANQHQINLPYTENFGMVDPNNPAQEIRWNETFSFDVIAGSPGSIAFYCHRNDFLTENVPQTAVFRMVITW